MGLRTAASFVLVGLAGLFLAAMSVTHGSVDIPTELIFETLFSEGPADGDHSTTYTIIWSLRMPRLVMAVLVGVALATAGAALQGLFQNPLADPYVLGISSGGSLGAVMAMVILSEGNSLMMAPAAGAFLGAAITAWMIYRLALTPLGLSLNAVLLAGIAIGLVCSALLSFVLISQPLHTADILGWLMGHLGGCTWHHVWVVLGCTVVGCTVLGANHLTLDAMLMGEDTAGALGVDLPKRKLMVLGACALLTAGAVAYCGLIGFVGLLVPHGARIMIGAQNRLLLPMSAGLGAALLMGADLSARTLLAQGEIPVGVITGCFGGLFFLILLRRGLRHD